MTIRPLLTTGIAALACAALPAASIAKDAECVSRAESQAVVAHLMPNLVKSTAKRCVSRLGADAYLADNAAGLERDLSPLSRQAWPRAKRALERRSGTALPDNDAILEIGRMAITEGIASELDAGKCGMVDELLEQLAPLPPENLARVFALFLETGLNNTKDAPFKVC